MKSPRTRFLRSTIPFTCGWHGVGVTVPCPIVGRDQSLTLTRIGVPGLHVHVSAQVAPGISELPLM